MSKWKLSFMMLCMLVFAVFFYGCGSGRDGSSQGAPQTSNIGDAACKQCHSGYIDPLTGEDLFVQYDRTSPHKDNPAVNSGNGCEACHGGASLHNGEEGAIPYANPYLGNGTRCVFCHTGQDATNAPTKFADSKHATNMTIEQETPCRRCHTHEGAVLGAAYGLTGPRDVMDNAAYQAAVPPSPSNSAFKCQTCHEHGGGLRPVYARDAAGNLVKWNPAGTGSANDQFNLCTSCHGLKTFDGSKIMASGSAASGTVAVGQHEDTWYRIIATTHLNNSDNVAAGGISGYILRMPSGQDPDATPCFDCHGHEARTETSNNPNQSGFDPNKTSIYRDWAMAAHSGRLLTAKFNAAGANPRSLDQVDLVMKTVVAPVPFIEYDWSSAPRQDCQRCHTATGGSNYLKDPAAYDPANNDFSHLAGWTTSNRTSKQREVLYCWTCHVKAASGILRTPGAITAPYNFKGTKAQFPEVAASDICISCHSGRESGESLDAISDFTNASFKNSHYRAAAGLMYVKAGFTGFVDPATPIGNSTYGKSLTSTDDGGAISSTHRKLGTTAINGDSHNTAVFTPGNYDSNGPCITCHMQATGQPNRPTSHTWAINANAYNQVCVNCHTSEGGIALTGDNFTTIFLKPQEEIFQDALKLAQTILLRNYNIAFDSSRYPYFYDLTKDPSGATPVKDWTRATGNQAFGKKLMGACFNLNLLTREPAAFVHARTYTRRLVYDTIDFLDDGTINLSSGATAIAISPSVYGKGASAFTDSTLTTLAPGTTEAMTYLIGWSRSTGAWNAIERP